MQNPNSLTQPITESMNTAIDVPRTPFILNE